MTTLKKHIFLFYCLVFSMITSQDTSLHKSPVWQLKNYIANQEINFTTPAHYETHIIKKLDYTITKEIQLKNEDKYRYNAQSINITQKVCFFTNTHNTNYYNIDYEFLLLGPQDGCLMSSSAHIVGYNSHNNNSFASCIQNQLSYIKSLNFDYFSHNKPIQKNINSHDFTWRTDFSEEINTFMWKDFSSFFIPILCFEFYQSKNKNLPTEDTDLLKQLISKHAVWFELNNQNTIIYECLKDHVNKKKSLNEIKQSLEKIITDPITKITNQEIPEILKICDLNDKNSPSKNIHLWTNRVMIWGIPCMFITILLFLASKKSKCYAYFPTMLNSAR